MGKKQFDPTPAFPGGSFKQMDRLARHSMMIVAITLLLSTVTHAYEDPSIVILDIKVIPSHVQTASDSVPYDDDYCFVTAEATYGIDARVLWSISRQESGHDPLAVNRNKNGTVDFCHMQINSGWKQVIGRENWRLLSNKCYCTMVGAWILADCVRRHGYNWEAVGCYNSPNRSRGAAYAQKINALLRKVNRGAGHGKRKP